MSYTYTQDISPRETEADFVPSYARRSIKTKKVKTWMVLAPIAGVVLLGGAAVMLLNSGSEDQPLAEPAPTPAISAPALLSSAPAEPVVVSEPAPATVTRPAPTARRAPAAEARPAVVEVEIAAPQAYQASPGIDAAASRIAPAPVSTPTQTAAPAPSIAVSPLN